MHCQSESIISCKLRLCTLGDQRLECGGDLVRVVERVVAPQLGISEIRMEALQHVVRYYDDVLGYEETGTSYQDPEWGLLTPKRKLLPRRP